MASTCSRESASCITGVTNNLQRRLMEHRAQPGSGFSARYKLRQLVYFETFGDIRAAIEKEKQIEGLAACEEDCPG